MQFGAGGHLLWNVLDWLHWRLVVRTGVPLLEFQFQVGLWKDIIGVLHFIFMVSIDLGTILTWKVEYLKCFVFVGVTPNWLGLAGIIWYATWLWLVFEKPAKHPTIKKREIRHIDKCIGPVSTVPLQIPWKAIFTSLPVYAIAVASFCRSWAFYLLLLAQTSYFSDEFEMAEVRGDSRATWIVWKHRVIRVSIL